MNVTKQLKIPFKSKSSWVSVNIPVCNIYHGFIWYPHQTYYFLLFQCLFCTLNAVPPIYSMFICLPSVYKETSLEIDGDGSRVEKLTYFQYSSSFRTFQSILMTPTLLHASYCKVFNNHGKYILFWCLFYIPCISSFMLERFQYDPFNCYPQPVYASVIPC